MEQEQNQNLNQTSQPVVPTSAGQNTFLTRMDMAAGAQTPEKKKSPIALILVIVVLLVGAIIAAVILLNQPQPITPEPTPEPTPTTPDVDLEMQERNDKRRNDLNALSEAVIKFQKSTKDNSLPNLKVKDWNTVISMYIPDGLKDSVTGDEYKIGGICRFVDSDCKDYTELTWEKNHNEIYIVYDAECKTYEKSNLIVSTTRSRRIVMYTILEGDETFACVTN